MDAVKNASEARQEDAGGAPRRGESAERPSPRSRERRRVILLVEDNETDQQLYGHLLWYNGYDVLHAADGETAIRLALETRPDLILLDMVLEGEMTGLDVAKRLRDEGLDVPMVALSARNPTELGAALEEAGIAAYLEKPVDPFVVVKEVLRRVGSSEPRDPETEVPEDLPGFDSIERDLPQAGLPEPDVPEPDVQ